MYRGHAVCRLIVSSIVLFCSCAQGPEIEVWYGKRQHFGRNGYPQKWINVLGRVTPSDDVASLDYSLNDASLIPLSVGPDGHRLANPGDFNIEIDRAHLQSGENTVKILDIDDANGNGVTPLTWTETGHVYWSVASR